MRYPKRTWLLFAAIVAVVIGIAVLSLEHSRAPSATTIEILLGLADPNFRSPTDQSSEAVGTAFITRRKHRVFDASRDRTGVIHSSNCRSGLAQCGAGAMAPATFICFLIPEANTHERIIYAMIVLCSLGLAAAPALAQQTTGNITGRVVDEQGSAVPGVTVTAEHADRLRPHRRHRRGRVYRLNALPGRHLRSDRGASGLQQGREQGHRVNVGQTLDVN